MTRSFKFLLLLSLAPAAALAQFEDDLTFNQLPNPAFLGTWGSLVVNATGQVPSLWRTFAVGSDVIESEIFSLPANALFTGSPPTQAVRLRVTTFGTNPMTDDSGFDTSPIRFALLQGRTYRGSVYLRSANADKSNQSVTMNLPVFDATGTFTGQFGNADFDVTPDWAEYSGADIAADSSEASGELAFRLNDDGGDHVIEIALPTVLGPSLTNTVPNPSFAGTGGLVVENVTGTVPDFWRAFALSSFGSDTTLETVPLAADELYPGSPATNAIKLTTVQSDGAGFDHEQTPLTLLPGDYRYRGQVWLRADNADNSDQGVSVALPVFDAGGGVVDSMASIGPTVTPQWELYGGGSFSGNLGATANIGFRAPDSGTENSVLIALPQIIGPAVGIFRDSFEANQTDPM